MHPVLFTTLFSSCVSALVLQPLITPAPQIAVRQGAQSICGYYSLFGIVETISCDFGTPCVVATNLSPPVGYCSDDIGPVSAIYPWGQWPSDQGCGYGSECCPLSSQYAGSWVFNGGSTVFLGCDTTSFSYTGFFSTLTPLAVSAAATPTATTHSSSSNPNNFAQNTSPILDSTATPTTAQPSQAASSTGLSETTKIAIIVVCGAVALISGLVFLWFLIMALRLHHKARNPVQPYTALPYQYSNPSLNSMPPVNPEKKGKLGKWAKIATIISPIFAIVGLVVAIYFGLKQR